MFLPAQSVSRVIPGSEGIHASRIRLSHSAIAVLIVLISLTGFACSFGKTDDTKKQATADSLAETARLDKLRQDSVRKDLTSTLDSLDSRIATFQRQLGKENTPEWDDIVWKIVMAGAVMLIVHFFLRFLGWILGSAAERNAVRRLWFKKWFPIVRLGFWSITIYIVVGAVFSFDRDSLILAGGTIGVAIGFAAQDVIKNIFGGILIILDQPFQVGDRVRVGGTYGEVVSIGLRSTRIVTPDDNLVTVPNTQVVDGQVANANSGALDCQVVTELFLPGWVDVSRAKQIAHSAAATSRYVYLNKPIVVLIKDEFEHAFLTKVIVKAYVLDARFENLFASDVTERAKVQFLEEGLLEPMYLTPFGEIHRAEREPGDSDSGKDDQQEGHDE